MCDSVENEIRIGVYVCHLSDCHYINANHWTERRINRMWRKMEKRGIRKERLQLEWISASEGIRFAQAMENMERIRKTVTPEETIETRKAAMDAIHRP
jgi:heterodisulfide reductase subunit A2